MTKELKNNQYNLVKSMEYFFYNGVDINEFIYNLMTISHDIIIIKNADLKNLWVNKNINKYNDKNISMQNFKEKPCYETIFNLKKPCKNCIVKKALKSKHPEKTEINSNNKNYLIEVYPAINENNTVIGFIVILLNITKRKKLYKELKYRTNKLDSFSTLAHEIKTPINTINAAVDMSKININNNCIKPMLKDNLKRYLNIIEKNNLRLQKYVNNILDINKIDHNKHQICLENTNIVNKIKEIINISYSFIKGQNKTIKFNTNVEKKIIATDVFDFERIIINLLSNAVKHTKDGDKITVNLTAYTDKIKISVIDNGVGISTKDQLSIFNKYEQANRTTNRMKEGTGLGLYITKSLLKKLGGNVKVKSKLENGSKFIIELPVKILANKYDHNNKSNQYTLRKRIKMEFSDIY